MDGKPKGHLADNYRSKAESYFTTARRDYVADLDSNPQAAILELGCGNGATGALALKEGKCATYVGIEIFEPMGMAARKVLTDVHVGDVETMHLPYDPGTFDALICSEVIEHLTDPRRVISALVRLLKPGGRIYASVPNISHWRIVLSLLGGRFEYRDQGPMDRTHLRWFTPKSFGALFEECGVKVDRLAPIGVSGGVKEMAFRLPLGHMLWYQIDLRGHRLESAPPPSV